MSTLSSKTFELAFRDEAIRKTRSSKRSQEVNVLTYTECQKVWEYAANQELIQKLLECLQTTTDEFLKKGKDGNLTCSDKTAILNYLMQGGAIHIKTVDNQSITENEKAQIDCDGDDRDNKSDASYQEMKPDLGITSDGNSCSSQEGMDVDSESDSQGYFKVVGSTDGSIADKESETTNCVDEERSVEMEDGGGDVPASTRFVYNWTIKEEDSDGEMFEDCHGNSDGTNNRFVVTGSDRTTDGSVVKNGIVNNENGQRHDCVGGVKVNGGEDETNTETGKARDERNIITVKKEVDESHDQNVNSDGNKDTEQKPSNPSQLQMMCDLLNTKVPLPGLGTLPAVTGIPQTGILNTNLVNGNLQINSGGICAPPMNLPGPLQQQLTPVMLANQMVYLTNSIIPNNQSVVINGSSGHGNLNNLNTSLLPNQSQQSIPHQLMLQPTPEYLSGLLNCLPRQGSMPVTSVNLKPPIVTNDPTYLSLNPASTVPVNTNPSSTDKPNDDISGNLEVATFYRNDRNKTIIREEMLFRSQNIGNKFQGHHSLQVWGNLLQSDSVGNLPQRVVEGNSNLKLMLKTSGDISNEEVVPSQGEVTAHVWIEHISPRQFVYCIEREIPTEGWKCTAGNCDAEFTSRNSLACHVTKMHPIGKYVCGICNECVEFRLLSKHMVNHGRNEKPFNEGIYNRSDNTEDKAENDVQQSVFRPVQNRNHILASSDITKPQIELPVGQQHSGTPPTSVTVPSVNLGGSETPAESKCQICNLIIPTRSLPLHLMNHTREYKCEFCDRVFTTSVSCANHRKVHTGDEKYKCEVCERFFVNAIQLECHMRIHTGIYPHHCPVCNKGFSKRGNLQHHLPSHSKEKAFQCTACNLKLKTAESLESHMKMHTGDKPFECGECGKRFVRRSHLRVHSKIHSDEKPFMCEQCGKSFRTNQRLNTHRQCHSGVKPHQCTICDRRFMWKRDLDRHIDSHKGNKQFMCDSCGKTFMRTEALKIHQRLHTQERPYKCDHCGKGFNQKVQLQLHHRSQSCFSKKSKGQSSKETN